MRIFNNPAGARSFAENIHNNLPILFTGSAILHLKNITATINLEEWEWHEEIVDGRKTCIVTNKIIGDLQKTYDELTR